MILFPKVRFTTNFMARMSVNRLVLFYVFTVCLLTAAFALAIGGKARSASLKETQHSAAMLILGRKLFFDAQLSQDGTVSCSSCHQPTQAFADGRVVSVGTGKRIGTRNTPSLLNVVIGEPLFWDGRRDQLDAAVLDPFTNAVEMGDSDLAEVIHKLTIRSDYRTAFHHAFPSENTAISATQVGTALTAFVRLLPQGLSAYDRYRAGNINALSMQAREGLRLFQGKAECSSCHLLAAGRFTDGQFHHSGVGLGDVDTHLGELTSAALQRNLTVAAMGSAIGQDPKLSALGRFVVSHQAIDVGAFRTPSLRNIGITAPYMHDGSIKTLEAAVDTEIYYRGLSTGRPISLTVDERREIIAFLRSLTAEP